MERLLAARHEATERGDARVVIWGTGTPLREFLNVDDLADALLLLMQRYSDEAIVNIASSHSSTIIPHTFPYPVAKHGLLGLTRSLGIEYAARGVRVNAIAPGYIDTEIARDYWATFDDPAAERARAEALHPPKRIGRPEEVAMTAVFLASDEAPFINAACIAIDGGRSVVYHD